MIGDKLFATSVAAFPGTKKVVVEVEKENERAKQFYENMDFVKQGRRK